MLVNTMRFIYLLPLTILLNTLSGCSSTPIFDSQSVDKSLTPQSVKAESSISLGKTALWGGTILDTRNLKTTTQIEVLAYPLDSSHRPLLDKKPLGRFIISHAGYLEPASYAQGRHISVLGKIAKPQLGKVGETQYTYPVINSEKVHLWSQEDKKSKTSFHFGIGVSM